MTSFILAVAAVVWLAVALCGLYVADQKGRPLPEGLVLGLLLGPIGVLVVACLPTLAEAEEPAEEPQRRAYAPRGR